MGQVHPEEGEAQSTQETREEGILSGVMATITSMITTPMMDFHDKTIQQEVAEDHPSGTDAAILEDGVTRDFRVYYHR